MILIKSKIHFAFCEFVKIINNINNRDKYSFLKINRRIQHYSFYNGNKPNQEYKNEGKKCVRHFLRFHKELKCLANKELLNDCYIDNKIFSSNIENFGKDENIQIVNKNNKNCDVNIMTNKMEIEPTTEASYFYRRYKEIVNKHLEKNIWLIYKTFQELSLKDIYYLYEKISNKDLFILFVIKLLNVDDAKENIKRMRKKVNAKNKLNIIDNLLYPFLICSDFYIRKDNIIIYKNIDFFK